MNITLLKLLLAPIIIGGASLAGRRWGHTVSGWLIGLPLTSGPVIFIVALSHSTQFAANTVLGTLSGGFPLVAFALTYAWLATRSGWPIAISGGIIAFGVLTVIMQNFVIPLAPLFVLVLLAILLGLKFMPPKAQLLASDEKPGPWDIPVRILIGTSFIIILTGIAPLIGPRLTGLFSTIPMYTAILTIFAHRLQGPAGAASVLRGLLFGLFAFASFYITLALLIEWAGIAPSFIAAILASLAIQGITFVVLKRENKAG
jgi:hypothetical protein